MLSYRKPTLKDVPILERWDMQPHVIACDPTGPYDWKKEVSLEVSWYEIILAELDERPIGVIQIIDPQLEDEHYWGEIGTGFRAIDIWIGEVNELNKGYGTKMMQVAIDKCFAEDSVHTILIDPLKSNEKAHRFYERMGFQFMEERVFDGDDCFVYQLKKA